jgi:arsenate reductase
MTVSLYEYARCGTCRKAVKWMRAKDIDFESIPIVDKPPSKTLLTRLWKRSGLPIRRFFNTSGGSYREGGFKDRLGSMTDAEAIDCLAADGMLIKRPLLVTPEAVLVGFREDEWTEVFEL